MKSLFSKEKWQQLFYTVSHPSDGFYWIRHGEKGSVAIAILMVVLFGLCFTLNRLLAGFVVNDINERTVNALWEMSGVLMLYLLLCAAGAFALILCGATLQEAVFDFVSCLGSTGVGTGFLGTESGPAPLLIGSAGMLLGRLEIIPLFMGGGHLGVDDSERSSPWPLAVADSRREAPSRHGASCATWSPSPCSTGPAWPPCGASRSWG